MTGLGRLGTVSWVKPLWNKNKKLISGEISFLLQERREFGVYRGIRDNFPKYVVSLDEFDMSRDGIKHRNIRDFLLAEEWN